MPRKKLRSGFFQNVLKVVSDYFSTRVRSPNEVFVPPTLKNKNLKFAFFFRDIFVKSADFARDQAYERCPAEGMTVDDGDPGYKSETNLTLRFFSKCFKSC